MKPVKNNRVYFILIGLFLLLLIGLVIYLIKIDLSTGDVSKKLSASAIQSLPDSSVAVVSPDTAKPIDIANNFTQEKTDEAPTIFYYTPKEVPTVFYYTPKNENPINVPVVPTVPVVIHGGGGGGGGGNHPIPNPVPNPDPVPVPNPDPIPIPPVLSSTKAITVFNFTTLVPEVDGIIDENNHTISLTVPFGIDVTTLVPTIAISDKALVSPNSNIAGDFTNPITYIVTAEDNSTQNYIVTVTIAPDPDTTPPVISAILLGPDSGYVKIGDVVSLLITADSAGYTDKEIFLNNVPTTNFIDNGDGTYSALYTVSEGDNNVRSGEKVTASVVLADSAGNENLPYTLVTKNTLKIDADIPTLVSAEVTSATTINVIFSEDIDGRTVNKTGTEFTVLNNTVLGAEEAEGVVTLTLTNPIGQGETPTLTYSSTKFKDLAGNQVASPVTITATNNVI